MYTLEAISFHEGVPGHHLQSALTQELELPDFRRNLYLSAFGEGWGFTQNSLGKKSGSIKTHIVTLDGLQSSR